MVGLREVVFYFFLYSKRTICFFFFYHLLFGKGVWKGTGGKHYLIKTVEFVV